MDINSIFEPLDNLLKSINTNKNLLILILILLGIYFTYISNSNSSIIQNSIYLFDNEIFKFVVFMIITYISSSCPAIGIALALIMFVSLQIITYIKIKKELDDELEDKSESESQGVDKEKFSLMEPVDMTYLNDEYLVNPLEKTSQLAPPINFNLKPITPKELSYQMISKGKNLLNDSFDLEQDLVSRYDTREKQIAFETQRNGSELVNSGINRLQMADQGEYNAKSCNSNKSNKVEKYSKLMNKNNSTNLSNPLIKASYNELIYNYNLLINKNLEPVEFELLLNKVYQSELDLLETIYKINKSLYSNEKQQLINKLITDIKNLSLEEKEIFPNKLEQLNMLMT
jgi:hypothetical protein